MHFFNVHNIFAIYLVSISFALSHGVHTLYHFFSKFLCVFYEVIGEIVRVFGIT